MPLVWPWRVGMYHDEDHKGGAGLLVPVEFSPPGRPSAMAPRGPSLDARMATIGGDSRRIDRLACKGGA